MLPVTNGFYSNDYLNWSWISVLKQKLFAEKNKNIQYTVYGGSDKCFVFINSGLMKVKQMSYLQKMVFTVSF